MNVTGVPTCALPIWLRGGGDGHVDFGRGGEGAGGRAVSRGAKDAGARGAGAWEQRGARGGGAADGGELGPERRGTRRCAERAGCVWRGEADRLPAAATGVGETAEASRAGAFSFGHGGDRGGGENAGERLEE